MMDSQPEPRTGCLKGCAAGCLVIAVLVIGLVVLTSRTVVQPFKAAIESRQELEVRFGDQGAYSPIADGSVAADRLEAFLTVRTALGPVCERFAELTAEFRNIEALGEEQDVSKVEAMSQAFETTQAAFRIAPLMGHYFDVRNRALLEAEMGFGEYTFIFTMAYGQRFSNAGDDRLFGGNPLNTRVREIVCQMLRNQRMSIPADNLEMAVILDVELAALAADEERVPWQDGLPEGVGLSLEPFQHELDEAFCEVTAGIDLLKNKERSFGIEAE